jgi:translation initiation factor IF-2
MMMEKAEREEIWQIITHLAEQGLNVQSYSVEGQFLKVTLSVPLLSKM